MSHEKITHIVLFSGIGGFALAADRVFGNVEHIFCDNEPFAQEVIKKHWPSARIIADIRQFTLDAIGDEYRTERGEIRKEKEVSRISGETLDAGGISGTTRPFILTGGFPCQPFSQAGRRRGTEDDRFLWPEMLRVIREFSPLWVIAENVRGLLTQGGGVVFERVCTDLEAAGYEVQPLVIPAVAVGAPHRRDRVWFVAHRESTGRKLWRQTGGDSARSEEELSGRNDSDDSNTKGDRRLGRNKEVYATEAGKSELDNIEGRHSWSKPWLEVATRLCRMDDGIPRRMDRNPRLKALGNAIVPAVAEEIMRAIKACE